MMWSEKSRKNSAEGAMGERNPIKALQLYQMAKSMLPLPLVSISMSSNSSSSYLYSLEFLDFKNGNLKT